MRFRRLELLRYGGFADRVFDFAERGDGPDLHLVFGPNEAGKSTALQAIGDLLFGIPGQSRQGWRFDYGQLRLRALIEHDGGVLDVTRRKGNRDTLLQADGAPFRDDPLAPLLGGIDRAAFERMFGLDHAQLRAGGEGILSGRDDAARITLEAGTGVSHIGRELAELTRIKTELFKPGGQNPPVNRLMRERADALAEVRQFSIGDAEWSQARQRRTGAEERRTALIAEAAVLDREQARLDRIGRARAPLAKLASIRGEVAGLGHLPDLPIDAVARLTATRGERTTAGELEAQARADLVRVEAAITEAVEPGPVLALRSAVEALEERRPVIAQAAKHLERRRAELERIDARLAAARAEAGLAEGAKLPTAGWRRRVSQHLDARREARLREGAASKQRAKLVHDRDEAARNLSIIGEGADPAALNAALALLPGDVGEALKGAQREAGRKRDRAAELLGGLSPWRGTAAFLATLDLPTEAEAVEARRAIDTARGDADVARKEAETADANAIRAEVRVEQLAAGVTLPTPEAVAAARAVRDEVVEQAQRRLVSDRRGGDGTIGAALVTAVRQADIIADRRDAEATRVAEHGLTVAARNEAHALRAAARGREAAYRETLEKAERTWDARLDAVGFERPLLPADWAAWLTRRSAAIEADREREAAARTSDELSARVVRARAAVATSLADTGGEELAPDHPRLDSIARTHAATLVATAARRARLAENIAAVDGELAALAVEDEALVATRRDLDVELGRLAAEAELAEGANEAALVDAVEAVGQVADEIGGRDGIARQVAGIERDRLAFERELAEVLRGLELDRHGSAVDQVRRLAAELRDAVVGQETLASLRTEHGRLCGELERIRGRLKRAGDAIGSLMRAAGVEAEAALDRVIADGARLAVLRAGERDTLADLAGLDNGAGLDLLAAEIAALPAEDEATARSRIEGRRHEMATEREELGRALNAAEDELARAATESGAADAQQRATEAGAALAQAAEEHVEAAAAAALLAWVLDRHRATNQAPLIARAGALFAQVTGRAFTGLTVGYGVDDRPVILATRVDGSEVGVESLSEGTRDQLYLALRLGSIAGRAAAGSLPVICDDLLITADDDRAAALLGVLAAAATHSQVIVFSHHEHLIDIARRAVGVDRFRLHRIEPTIAGLAA